MNQLNTSGRQTQQVVEHLQGKEERCGQAGAEPGPEAVMVCGGGWREGQEFRAIESGH